MKEKEETSFIAKFKRNGHDFAIYIYDEDAEIHRDATAFVCERTDYDSEADLIQDFISRLSQALSNEDFEGNRK